MNILGIIPARKGSKRVPGKNTKPLLGIPLIEYVLKASVESTLLSKIVVSSDDEKVEELVKTHRRVDFIKRPEALATDESPAIDYVLHALNTLATDIYEIVVIIQPTTPFLLAGDIDGTVQLLLNDKNADSAVSVAKINQLQHPYKLKVLEGTLLLPYLTDEGESKPAHQLPEVYSRNGGVYAARIATIKRRQIIGDACLGYVMPSERSIDINDPIDFEFAEFLCRKSNSDGQPS